MTPTPATPEPDAPRSLAAVRDSVASRFDLSDRRNLIGLGVLAFCAGIMVGARIMRGVPTAGVTEVPGEVVYVDAPCAGCREAALQREAALRQARGGPPPVPPVHPNPDAEAEQAAGRRTFTAYQPDGPDNPLDLPGFP
jgi:hypothetical protein